MWHCVRLLTNCRKRSSDLRTIENLTTKLNTTPKKCITEEKNNFKLEYAKIRRISTLLPQITKTATNTPQKLTTLFQSSNSKLIAARYSSFKSGNAI